MQKRVICNLFIWDDELDVDTMTMVSVSEINQIVPKSFQAKAAAQTVCQCKWVEIFKDWESKKISKLKLKLLDERKMRWMQAIPLQKNRVLARDIREESSI